MSRIISLAMIGTTALLIGGCNFSHAEARDAGPAIDRNYALGAFDHLVVAGPYDVVVTTGGQPGARAHGGQALLDETDIKVEDGALIIGPREKHGISWNWGNKGHATVTVSAAALHGATLAGSGDVRINRVAGGDFKGNVAGSGNLSINQLQVGALEVSVAGSGNVHGAGSASRLEASIAGSGDIDLAKLTVADAEVSIVGSGNVRAHATGTADVTTMGSGDIDLTGGAKCTVSKHGSGDVRCS